MDDNNLSNFEIIIFLAALIFVVWIIPYSVVVGIDNYQHTCKLSGCNRFKTKYQPYCSEHTCRKDGCDEIVCTGHKYCYDHQVIENERLAAKRAYEATLPKCSVKNCTNKVSDGGTYCYIHECSDSRCNNRVIDKYRYCTYHNCPNTDCYNSKEKNDKYCKTCQRKIDEANKKKTSYSTTTKKSTSTKKKVRMPDCDDYEDYDDFMDDWDGRMPDGSDAEDYWENW